jgi:Fe-S oxidoreductase
MKRAKRVILNTYARPSLMNLLFKIGSRAQLPVTRRKPYIRARKAPILRTQTRWRSLPALATRPARDRQKSFVAMASVSVIPSAVTGKTAAIFPGCMTDRLYPEQAEAVATVLAGIGVKIVPATGLHCCGLPAQNSGDLPNARSMAKQTIAQLEKVEADYIVSGSASCVAVLAQDYLHQFRDDPEWLPRAKRLSERIVDLTSFLVNEARLESGSLTPGDGEARTITYHDSCQGLNALGLSKEPRYLIEEVMGDSISELQENTLCCGFGGSFSFDYPTVAERLMNRKLRNAEATGVRTIVTDNQGCIMHLRGGLDAQGKRIEVRHISELLAERVRERTATHHS